MWNSSEPPHFHGAKKSPTANRSISVWELLQSLRSAPLYPRDFDYMLENRGYSVQHITNVMTVDLDNAVLDASVTDVLFFQ